MHAESSSHLREAAISFGDQGPIGCHGPFPFHAGKDGREQMSEAFAESIQAMVSLESLSLDITSLCRNHLEALLSELRVIPSLKLQRLKLGSLKNCEAFVEYAGTNLKTLYLPSMICFRGQFEHLEDLYIHMNNFNNPMLETTNIARVFPRLKSLGFLEDLCAESHRSYGYSRLDPCQGCVRDGPHMYRLRALLTFGRSAGARNWAKHCRRSYPTWSATFIQCGALWLMIETFLSWSDLITCLVSEMLSV
jgi:hypothetical protein